MKHNVTVISMSRNYVQEVYLEFPHVCPHCDQGMSAKHLQSYTVDDCTIYSVYFCPNCENIFMIRYHGCPDGEYHPNLVLPNSSRPHIFPQNIQKLSPMFCQIYNDSLEAEQRGLTTICGMGYRKALEFLVKDYAITRHPDKEEEIKKIQLYPCIQEYIDNVKIKNLATACAWIGNDETHYVRKHHDYNTDSLKSFVLAAVSFIDSELEVDNAAELLKR